MITQSIKQRATEIKNQRIADLIAAYTAAGVRPNFQYATPEEFPVAPVDTLAALIEAGQPAIVRQDEDIEAAGLVNGVWSRAAWTKDDEGDLVATILDVGLTGQRSSFDVETVAAIAAAHGLPW